MADKFLEGLRRSQEAAQAPASPQTKPIEAMTDEELKAAESEARRALLDLQHPELRDRELARLAPAEKPPEATFADVLREAKRNTRRRWR